MESRSTPGPATLQHHDAVLGCLREAGFSIALVNNVGGNWNTRHVTADGLERTFALNHLAPFLLTSLLLGRLNGAPRPAWSRSLPTCRPGSGPGRHHVNPPGVRSRPRAGDGPLLRQQQTQEIF